MRLSAPSAFARPRLWSPSDGSRGVAGANVAGASTGGLGSSNPGRAPVSLRQLPGRMVLAVDRAEAVGFVVQPLFSAAALRLEALLVDPLTAAAAEYSRARGDSAATDVPPPSPTARWRLLPLTDLLAIGPEAVTVPSRFHLRSLEDRPGQAALIDWAALPDEPGAPSRRWLVWFGRRTAPDAPTQAARGADRPLSAEIRTAAGQPSWSHLFRLPVLTDQGEQLGLLHDLWVERVGGRLVRVLYRPPSWWSRWLAPLAIPGSQVRAIGPDACVVAAGAAATAPPR